MKLLTMKCMTMMSQNLGIRNSTNYAVSKGCKGYEESISALNNLQSNASVLQKSTTAINKHEHGENSIKDSYRYLQYAGLTEEDLNQLSVIHVTGTKGKGSTCAFTESILRHHGFKTGFYSSPHLIAVRERIRINGVPLGKDVFSDHFWRLYEKFLKNKTNDNDMPPYFKFLTIMAFQIFLEMKVDVAVIEVGVGGQYDCTNVIKKPVVCGISSLGIDHVNVLGNSIQEIAWNKAGIFKAGAPAFTVPQPNEGMQVLLERAAERKTSLHLCPDLITYGWNYKPIKLGLKGSVQHMNATLALQLSHAWMQITGHNQLAVGKYVPKYFTKNSSAVDYPPLILPFNITDSFYTGLQECSWPGRSQIIHHDSVTYFLDGAHTVESIMCCIDWFKESSYVSSRDKIFRILIYNCTGSRDPGPHLIPLSSIGFDLVIFCPNVVSSSTSDSSDQKNMMSPVDIQLNRCKTHQQFWSFLMSSHHEHKYSSVPINDSSDYIFTDANDTKNETEAKFCNQKSYHTNDDNAVEETPSFVFPCIQDALAWAVNNRDVNIIGNSDNMLKEHPQNLLEADQLHILVTGSLHLIGGVLAVIDPELTSGAPNMGFNLNKQKVAHM